MRVRTGDVLSVTVDEYAVAEYIVDVGVFDLVGVAPGVGVGLLEEVRVHHATLAASVSFISWIVFGVPATLVSSPLI